MRRILNNLSPASFIFILAIAILLFGFQNCAPIADVSPPNAIAQPEELPASMSGKTFSTQEEIFNCTSTTDTVCAALHSRLLYSQINLSFSSDLTAFIAKNDCHEVFGKLTISNNQISFEILGISDISTCPLSSPWQLQLELEKLSEIESIRKTGVGFVLEGATFKLPFNEWTGDSGFVN